MRPFLSLCHLPILLACLYPAPNFLLPKLFHYVPSIDKYPVLSISSQKDHPPTSSFGNFTLSNSRSSGRVFILLASHITLPLSYKYHLLKAQRLATLFLLWFLSINLLDAHQYSMCSVFLPIPIYIEFLQSRYVHPYPKP